MKPTMRFTLASALFLSVTAINAHAALYDRGNGMIYDSAQNITWLQDANYAKTSGYDADGRMTWEQSKEWASTLVYGGHAGWRLSSAVLNGTGFMYGPDDYNGVNDASYNNTRSEIGHLFFELGNKAQLDQFGDGQEGWGLTNTIFVDAATHLNVGFVNIGYSYWAAEEGDGTRSGHAWAFSTSVGRQGYSEKWNVIYAWAVHDGDIANVSSVPVPAAAWLFGSALLGLVGAAQRKSA